MIREWTLTRHAPIDDAILGLFDPGTGATCFSLERTSRAISVGRYRVRLTESQRVRQGSLWAPYTDAKLPLLLDVPGRDGIRIHAANAAQELHGCVAVGALFRDEQLLNARPAVTRLVNELRLIEDQPNGEVWLTVRDGGATRTPPWAKGPVP